MKTRLFCILIALLLGSSLASAGTKTVDELTELTTPRAADELLIQDTSATQAKKITYTRMVPEINVTAHGAIEGDGLSDSVAFQAAFDAITPAATGGLYESGIVVIPPGTWNLDTQIVVDEHGVAIKAEGAVISYGGTSGAAFKIQDADYVSFEKGNIYLEEDGVAGILLENAERGTYQGITIGGDDADTSNMGIQIDADVTADGTYYNRFDMITLDQLGYGIHSTGPYANANSFTNMSLVSIETVGLNWTAVTGNVFRGSIENDSSGIPVALKASGTDYTTDNLIELRWIEGGTEQMVDVDASSEDNKIIVVHNAQNYAQFSGKNYIEKLGDANNMAGKTESPWQDYQDLFGGRINRYNYLSFPEAMDSWTATNVTVTADDTTGWDGTSTADLVSQDATNGTVSQAVTITAAECAARWTFSVWLRGSGDSHFVELKIISDSTQRAAANVWVSADWHRYDISVDLTAQSDTSITAQIRPSIYDGATKDVYVWGAKLERGWLGTYTNKQEVVTFADSDATPNIGGGKFFKTGTSVYTITNFDNPVEGQEIVVETKGEVTYDVSTNIDGGTTNIVTTDEDVVTFYYNGSKWKVKSFMDMSDNLN
jgi:hypothetical protein